MSIAKVKKLTLYERCQQKKGKYELPKGFTKEEICDN